MSVTTCSVDHSTLRTSDPLAATVDTLGDVDPGVTERLIDWLKNYDPADGVHEIGHGEAPYSVEDTVAFIDACHASWKKLIENSNRVIDVFDGDGAPSGPNYILFSGVDRLADSLRDRSGVG